MKCYVQDYKMAGNPFVEEIDYREIILQRVVGKGAFGTVKKGKWRNIDVAIKEIETEQEKNAFVTEVQQLSRVSHPNIVKLYGACTKTRVCLVMEYAEDGSLHNVLHKRKNVEYSLAHGISWLLQAANGMCYLHNMKPRPLIHRDLKPGNLLLVNGGTVLKICDFGTVCDKRTKMTDTKGSASWMAPEVFEGDLYSEKCDVYSWGIILWEVLTREEPYQDFKGAPAFSVMWAVHMGKRPPLIAGCPKFLENLMTRAWSKNPAVRPSMLEIYNELSVIFKFMKGADKRLTVTPTQEEEPVGALSPRIITAENRNEIISSESKTILAPKQIETFSSYVIVNENLLNVEDAGERYVKDIKKRHSADLSTTDTKISSNLGHRRTTSCDSPLKPVNSPNPSSNNISDVLNLLNSSDSIGKNDGTFSNASYSGNYFFLVEPKLRPIPPVQCAESMEIYDTHLNLARELFRYRNEIALLTERKNELEEQLKDRANSSSNIEEYCRLKEENKALLQLQQSLKRQLEIIRSKEQRNSDGSDKSGDWVFI